MHGRGGRGGEAADDVGEVGFRIKTPAAGAGCDGVEDGAVFACFPGTKKEEVLFADGTGAE